MKGKNLLLLLLLPLFGLWAAAAPVSRKQAETVARQFLRLGSPIMQRGTTADGALTLADERKSSENDVPLYYVFDNGTDGGFIIVSGDDTTMPVLGYTTSGHYDATQLPDGLRDLMNGYARQLEAIAAQPAAPRRTATAATFTGTKVLSTAKWNQLKPFNQYTPNNYYTGCVATAMSIVMKYWTWPIKGVGSHSYYCNSAKKTLSANFGSTTYSWNDMLNDYNGKYTTQQGNAVATIMYHAGVAVEMDYLATSSSAPMRNVGNALVNHFRYDQRVRMLYAENYNEQFWATVLRNEINNNRPILYSGSGSGSHMFIVDGYKDELFQINWGWGGLYNGFFALNNMKPSAEHDYSYEHWAIINIMPDETGTVYSPLQTYPINMYEGLTANFKGDVKANNTFKLYVGPITCQTLDESTFKAPLYVGLFNSNGNLREMLGQTDIELKYRYHYSGSTNFTCKATTDAQAGDYLALYTLAEESTKPQLVLSSLGKPITMPATGNTPQYAKINFDCGSSKVTVHPYYSSTAMIGTNYWFYVDCPDNVEKITVESDNENDGLKQLGDETINGKTYDMYYIPCLFHDTYNIKVRAYVNGKPLEDATGIVSVSADYAADVRTVDGKIQVTTLRPTTVTLVDMSGAIVARQTVDGTATLTAPHRGVYIVRVGSKSVKVML